MHLTYDAVVVTALASPLARLTNHVTVSGFDFVNDTRRGACGVKDGRKDETEEVLHDEMTR